MRYYATDDRLKIVRRGKNDPCYYRWDWIKKEWVPSSDLMFPYSIDSVEITEEEAIYAIEHRKVPIVSHDGS